MMRQAIATQIGRHLTERRIAAQVSLRELGQMAGISAAGLSLIETGHVLAPLDTLYRVCGALGI